MEKREDGKTYLDADELAIIYAKYGKPGEFAPGRRATGRHVNKPTADQVKRGGDNGRAEQKRLREAAQSK